MAKLLSHDIKTPIASIKAVTEVLQINETDSKKKNLEIIQRKSSEIDDLITDMFNVTLQDLSELKLQLCEMTSSSLEQIILQADYLNKLSKFSIPDCIILADILRLGQVIGNIINNSYKYAGTNILITSEIIERQLILEFRDFGLGTSRIKLFSVS